MNKHERGDTKGALEVRRGNCSVHFHCTVPLSSSDKISVTDTFTGRYRSKRFPADFPETFGEHPGDHNHQDFPKSTAKQIGGVLQYKWEVYCDTNGRSTDNISLSSECRGTESTAIQIGGVLQYKLKVYFDTFLRSSGGWGF